MCLPLQGRTRDLHPLEFAHAGRTKVAVVSIPAFGSFPMKRRLKWVIIKILNDMHNIDQLNTSRVYQKTYKRRLLPSSVKRLNTVHKRKTNKKPIDKNYDLNDNQIKIGRASCRKRM